MSKQNYRPTTVNEYFAYLEQTVAPETPLYQAAHTYLEGERASLVTRKESKPFLSVITRTQGKRPAMLTETLLCLTGQSNQNFEVLLMGHNLSEDQHKLVSQIIADLPEWMRERVRLIPVNGGTRTTPLNEGFAAAKGEYIAILDDDDIVFERWVDCFYEMAQKEPGKTLHSYAIYQDWETVVIDGIETPRAVGTPQKQFCRDFILNDELSLNICPPVALAFPAFAFHEYGIRFDETLTTTEDWDYLMRVAFLTGVANNSEVTAHYRNWVNAENSHTIHSNAEWDHNYNKITDYFQQIPIVFRKEDVRHLMSDRIRPVTESSVSCDAELFYQNEKPFSEGNKMKAEYPDKAIREEGWPIVFSSDWANAGEVSAIRIDPCFRGGVSVRNFRVKIVAKDASERLFTASNIAQTNGIFFADQIVFLKNDPQIVLNLNAPTEIAAVYVDCDIQPYVDDATVDALTTHHSFLYRVLRKIWRKLKRIFGK